MKLELTLKQHYGQNRFYPMNDVAKKICLLVGQPTLTEKQLGILKTLGFEIDIAMQASVAKVISRIKGE